MNHKILKLPETVINQIAAGEVVENPASVVKELVENSLDAGAQRVSVEIIAGGQQLIRIEDDGCGMGSEDALLCLERHATSKIRSVDDLEELKTLGFRGEALAAIASVSHFTLQTASQGVGTSIVAEGGAIRTVEPCARNRGTTLEIRSLFYNVPARKKFQKSAAANAAQVSRVLETLALAYPEVTFVLKGKREYLATSAPKRVEDILGAYEHEVQAPRVSGFVAAPFRATSTRLGQYVFINRRPIFSPLIAKAVKTAFGTRIAEHAYPPFVLFLQIPPESFDVNVHPQKKEVRFKEESRIFQEVEAAVASLFASEPLFASSITFTPPPISFAFAERTESFLPQETPPSLPLLFSDRPLAVFGSYLLLQKEGPIAVDLRSLHARLLFDALRGESGPSQALLWPLEVDIHREEEELVAEFNAKGIECRKMGPLRIAIDALPPWLDMNDFPLFLDHWRQKKKLEWVTTSFCRKLQKRYSLEEAQALWAELQKSSDRIYDPLGNPIWKEINLERLFHHG